MVRKRIGNTLKFLFHPKLNGEPIKDSISVVLTDPNGVARNMELHFDGDDAFVIFEGIEQKRTGVYNLSIYYNKGKKSQAICDKDIVELVPRTKDE